MIDLASVVVFSGGGVVVVYSLWLGNTPAQTRDCGVA